MGFLKSIIQAIIAAILVFFESIGFLGLIVFLLFIVPSIKSCS